MTKLETYQIHTSYMDGKLTVKNGIIIDAPLIIRWAEYRKIDEIEKWVKSKKGGKLLKC